MRNSKLPKMENAVWKDPTLEGITKFETSE